MLPDEERDKLLREFAENGWLTASWDAPRGQGGISTQGKDLSELEHNVREAVRCHFENGN